MNTHTRKTQKSQCFPLFLWTEVQPVHTLVLTQAYGPALSQSKVSILSVFCLVYNKWKYTLKPRPCKTKYNPENKKAMKTKKRLHAARLDYDLSKCSKRQLLKFKNLQSKCVSKELYVKYLKQYKSHNITPPGLKLQKTAQIKFLKHKQTWQQSLNPIRPGLFSRSPGPGGSEARMPKIKVNIN